MISRSTYIYLRHSVWINLVDNYSSLGEGKWSRQWGKEKGGEGQAREEVAKRGRRTWISSNFEQ